MVNESAELKINNKEIKQYEEETGKKAIWRGKLTDSFLKWQKGEKIYSQKKNREKIAAYLEPELKEKWLNFAKEYNYTSISKLTRKGVNFLIEITKLVEQYGEKSEYNAIISLTKDCIKSNYKKEKFTNSEILHDLKEPLSIIKGFANLAVEDFSKPESLRFIKEIQKSCNVLEEKINIYFQNQPFKLQKYKVLLIEDDLGTSNLVIEHFKRKGYSIKSVQNSKDAMKELSVNIPKLILLDIFLPDMTGNDFYKKLQSNINYKNIPVVYLTAIPKKEAEEKIKGAEANGLILKPFEFEDFKSVSKFLG